MGQLKTYIKCEDLPHSPYILFSLFYHEKLKRVGVGIGLNKSDGI
jgi:hypothetical protein